MKKKFAFSRKHLAIPYAVFLVVFVIIPLFFVVIYAFSAPGGGFTFNNFAEAWRMSAFRVLLESILFAFLTTLICFVIAYPIAFILSNPKFNRSYVTVLLFIVPMWINFMLRTYALMTIFEVFFGSGYKGYAAALAGTVYDFLPFMILPIYTTLSGVDKNFAEASADLGATPVKTFLRVTFPLSAPGIASGAIMVFMPTISSFAIVELLGTKTVLFGTLINMTYLKARGVSSAMALVMLILVGLSVFAANKLANKQGGIAEIKGGAW